MNVQVSDVPERQRFEAVLDAEVVGFAAYRRTDLDYRAPASKVTD